MLSRNAMRGELLEALNGFVRGYVPTNQVEDVWEEFNSRIQLGMVENVGDAIAQVVESIFVVLGVEPLEDGISKEALELFKDYHKARALDSNISDPIEYLDATFEHGDGCSVQVAREFLYQFYKLDEVEVLLSRWFSAEELEEKGGEE
jgi:hypothetical protein